MKGWFDLNNKILVADDEKEIRDLLEIYLLNEGYKVVKAKDGQEALDIIENEDVDLLVLDIMMPKVNGIEVCKKVRQNKNMPILMLSAKSEDMDKIQGLMTGADDYMTKPFNPLEFTVRVKALLRRSYYLNNNNSSEESDLINVGSLTIDKTRHRVVADGEEISLTAREFDILYLMASNKGRVFSSEEIFEKVWKEKYFQSNNTVMVHISRLRDKLDKHLNLQFMRDAMRGIQFQQGCDEKEDYPLIIEIGAYTELCPT